MRDHAQLRPLFWIQGTGKLLKGDREAREMALYLMSAPGSNMLGLYYLPLPTLQHELGYDTPEGASKALRRVCDTGFAVYDDQTEHVFVVNLAAINVGETLVGKDKRLEGIRKSLKAYRNNPLYLRFLDRYAEAYGLTDLLAEPPKPKGLARGIEGPPKPGSGSGEGSGTGERERARPPAAEEPVLEPDEPPPETQTPELVRKRFTSWFAKHRQGTPPTWGPNNAMHLRTLADWLDAMPDADPRKLLERTLAGFFADPKARSKGYPIAYLAQNPAEYLHPPEPERDVRRSGFVAPAPTGSYGKPTNLDELYGPELPRDGTGGE